MSVTGKCFLPVHTDRQKSVLLRQSLRCLNTNRFQCSDITAAFLGMRRLYNGFSLVFLRTWNANGTSAAVFLCFIADKGIPSVRRFQKGNCISFHQISFNRYFKIFSVYQFRMLAHHKWPVRVHECSTLHRLSAEPGNSSQAATFLFLTCLKDLSVS